MSPHQRCIARGFDKADELAFRALMARYMRMSSLKTRSEPQNGKHAEGENTFTSVSSVGKDILMSEATVMCTSSSQRTVGTREHGRVKFLGAHDLQRKVDPDRRTLAWCRKCAGFSTVYLHTMLLNVCRPTDSRVKYQVNKFEQGINPDRI